MAPVVICFAAGGRRVPVSALASGDSKSASAPLGRTRTNYDFQPAFRRERQRSYLAGVVVQVPRLERLHSRPGPLDQELQPIPAIRTLSHQIVFRTFDVRFRSIDMRGAVRTLSLPDDMTRKVKTQAIGIARVNDIVLNIIACDRLIAYATDVTVSIRGIQVTNEQHG